MNEHKFILIGAGIAAAVVAYFALKKVGTVAGSAVIDAASAAADAVNPFNNDNIINQGFTSVYQATTGSTGTLGTDIYDVTHPAAAKDTNVINGAATTIYQKITGSTGSIGTDIYDWLHPSN